jgi:hypothetical protein
MAPILVFLSSFTFSSHASAHRHDLGRRRLVACWTQAAGCSLLAAARPALAVNDAAEHGSAKALAPIVAFAGALGEAVRAAEEPALDRCGAALSRLPASQAAFKASLDRFSEANSYMSEYKDKNAFVVYYTGGFDGPGRARLGTREDVDPQRELQSLQNGFRNEGWASLDDARATLDVLAKAAPSGASDADDLADLRAALRAAEKALLAYIELAPPGTRESARRLAQGGG